MIRSLSTNNINAPSLETPIIPSSKDLYILGIVKKLKENIPKETPDITRIFDRLSKSNLESQTYIRSIAYRLQIVKNQPLLIKKEPQSSTPSPLIKKTSQKNFYPNATKTTTLVDLAPKSPHLNEERSPPSTSPTKYKFFFGDIYKTRSLELTIPNK